MTSTQSSITAPQIFARCLAELHYQEKPQTKGDTLKLDTHQHLLGGQGVEAQTKERLKS